MNQNNAKRHIRFRPDKNTLAWVAEADANAPADEGRVGLVVNESQSGCSITFVDPDELIEGHTYSIQVGDLPVLKANLVWRKKLDDHVVRTGFEYLE